MFDFNFLSTTDNKNFPILLLKHWPTKAIQFVLCNCLQFSRISSKWHKSDRFLSEVTSSTHQRILSISNTNPQFQSSPPTTNNHNVFLTINTNPPNRRHGSPPRLNNTAPNHDATNTSLPPTSLLLLLHQG